VFKGLVTATNEYGEIRMQFYVVTDGHDQMESAVQAFLATTSAYGQRPLDLVFTDNRLLSCPQLDAPPNPRDVSNKYSAVLGDGFHAMHRPKVPMEHDSKKAYFVALQEAFYAWDPSKLEELKANMRDAGKDDKEIEGEMYYNSQFFRNCVPRLMLPPRQLYWRVRAVFVTYGNKRDGKSNQPLFNDRAWAKANNILTEILTGYYSDPPGYSFYSIRLKPNG